MSEHASAPHAPQHEPVPAASEVPGSVPAASDVVGNASAAAPDAPGAAESSAVAVESSNDMTATSTLAGANPLQAPAAALSPLPATSLASSKATTPVDASRTLPAASEAAPGASSSPYAAPSFHLRPTHTVADAAAAAAAAQAQAGGAPPGHDAKKHAASSSSGTASSSGGGAPSTAAARAAAQRERAPLRKGKWTMEEEHFTTAIIREFERGMLSCPPGTTLRSYLSEKLHCDPMRITKKFAGDASIGKRVFTPCKQTPENVAEARRVRSELGDMERRFAGHLQHASLAYAASAAFKAANGRGRSASSPNLGGGARGRSTSAGPRGGRAYAEPLDVGRPIAVDASGNLLQAPSYRRGPATKRARDDAAPVKAEDSQLLLDFFVAVQERSARPAAAAAPPPLDGGGAPPAADAPPGSPRAATPCETKDRSDSCATRATACASPTRDVLLGAAAPMDVSAVTADDRPAAEAR